MNNPVKATTNRVGLSTAQVAERIASGQTNDVPNAPVRSTGEILKANVLTPVNAIMGALLVLILVAGFPGDALFAGVIVSNSVIGTIQEFRARRTLSELAVLSAPRARVIRDSQSLEVGVSEVVADEFLVLEPGDQVVVDGTVVEAVGLEIDESLLTGEAEPVEKSAGDPVLSGSFVSAGSGCYQATRIGADSYAASLSDEARQFKLARSELRSGVNSILRWLVLVIPPAAGLLLLRLLATEDRWEEALRGTVAAAVAMVPDGLVLLTSLSFITGVVALARRRALCKELASVELLARVDVLCLDKTGTITTGEISLAAVESLNGEDPANALGAIAAADPSPNATLTAVAEAHPNPGWEATNVIPFSSARKWASVDFAGRGTFHLGAPDVVLSPNDEQNRQRVTNHADQGLRVLVLTHSESPAASPQMLPDDRVPVCLVLLEDTMRSDAPEILGYFADQGVEIKIISGDHPATVASVARRAGVSNATVGVDARQLPADGSALADAVAGASVFGRVTPHQKRAMVAALQARGRTVAMTGDGVNDVLALKDADMGIAMGGGSSASRAVAQLVLLDNRFATLPRVLAEGRRVINNIERVANLFIAKAGYAVLLTALIGLVGSPFPFHPKQLTLIGTFSIGLPGFFLALAPNREVVRSGFLRRVLSYSLPAGIAAATATFACYEVIRRSSATLAEARTGATVTLLAIGLVILVSVSRPIRAWKLLLASAMALSYVAVIAVERGRDYFEMDMPPASGWVAVIISVLGGGLLVMLLPNLASRSTAARLSKQGA